MNIHTDLQAAQICEVHMEVRLQAAHFMVTASYHCYHLYHLLF